MHPHPMPKRPPPRFDRATLDDIRRYLAGYPPTGAMTATDPVGPHPIDTPDDDPEADARALALGPVVVPLAPAPVPEVPRFVAPSLPRPPALVAATPRGTQLVLPTFGSKLGALVGTAARTATRPRRGLAKAPAAPPSVVLPEEVVVVDTETTGIDRRARLVEIGALRVRRGVVVDRFQTLVDPAMPIPPEVIRVHGITDAMVRGAPQADAALAAFLAWVQGAALVAHNASFDRRIFIQELARVGRPLPGLAVFCTLRMARKALPGHPGYGLGALAQALRIPVTEAHRALADCHTTFGLLGHLLAKHSPAALGAFHGPPRLL
jgi:DNA polymerase III epsilon subunit family exonuclease